MGDGEGLRGLLGKASAAFRAEAADTGDWTVPGTWAWDDLKRLRTGGTARVAVVLDRVDTGRDTLEVPLAGVPGIEDGTLLVVGPFTDEGLPCPMFTAWSLEADRYLARGVGTLAVPGEEDAARESVARPGTRWALGGGRWRPVVYTSLATPLVFDGDAGTLLGHRDL